VKIPFLDILKMLPVVGPVVAQTAEFKERFEALLKPLEPSEQGKLRDALEDLRADNDEGHARLQDKLARASQR
jgi:hypothetical protein